MTKLSEEKREVLSFIDAILTMIEKYPTLNWGGMFSNLSVSASVNPFDFLLSIIGRFVTEEQMRDWLVKILTYSLPGIEIAIKGVLLANLKESIDCLNDPRIPEWMRKNPFSQIITEDGQSKVSNDDRGIIIDLKSIDYANMLSYSPMSQEGSHKYFGTASYYTFDSGAFKDRKFYTYANVVTEIMKFGESQNSDVPSIYDVIDKSQINSVYELARAVDFNAFLWFVKNKARFLNPQEINGNISSSTLQTVVTYEDGEVIKQPFQNCRNKTILSYLDGVKITATDSFPQPFTVGSTFIQSFSNESEKKYINTISLCFKEEVNPTQPMVSNNDVDLFGIDESYNVLDEVAVTESAPKTYNYHIAPVSSNWNSANWYVNSGTYFNFLRREENRVKRDYGKDFPLCNIEVVDKDNAQRLGLYSYDDCVKFTILPAPFVSHLNKRILFNAKGEADKNGHFTVIPTSGETISGTTTIAYTLQKGHKLYVDLLTSEYYLDNEEGRLTELIECYPGLTVYDFNYNFVMGMQLYDPTVVASQLIEAATNLRYSSVGGINFGLNKTEAAYQMRIAEVINKMITSEASYGVSDCYFSFSNNKFTEMLEKAELKRSNAYDFNIENQAATTISMNDVYDMLNEFNDNGTLVENQDVLTRAISTATVRITEEVLGEDKYNIRVSLIEQMIKSLVFILVSTLLTPKIILLFKVNRELLGKQNMDLSFEEFLESIMGLITKIILEIRELILRELLSWALDLLKTIAEKMASMLFLEQIEYYTRILRALLKACSFKFPKTKVLDTQLDVVNYADIDQVEESPIQEC